MQLNILSQHMAFNSLIIKQFDFHTRAALNELHYDERRVVNTAQKIGLLSSSQVAKLYSFIHFMAERNAQFSEFGTVNTFCSNRLALLRDIHRIVIKVDNIAQNRNLSRFKWTHRQNICARLVMQCFQEQPNFNYFVSLLQAMSNNEPI